MIKKRNKNADRRIRHERVRKHLSGTPSKPRLDVYRSTMHIYAQIIDDINGITLCAASTVEQSIKASLKGKTKKEQAELIGKTIAERAKKVNVSEVVFDRGGYLYTGRVEALAKGAREAGLKF